MERERGREREREGERDRDWTADAARTDSGSDVCKLCSGYIMGA